MAHDRTRNFTAECSRLPLTDALNAFADFCDTVADEQGIAKDCPECRGEGTVETAHGPYQYQDECEACDGSGKVSEGDMGQVSTTQQESIS